MVELSVIMPVYNAEKFLDISIQSVLNQTFENFELILIDDGSTDNSLEICKKYEKLDHRIKVFHKENKGISEARNTGLSLAKGEYIGFIDSDDIIHFQMYEIMLKEIKRHDSDVVMCDACRERKGIRKNNFQRYEAVKLSKNEYYRKMFYTSQVDWLYMVVWNKLYKRSKIGNIRFKSDAGTEDTIFNCEFFLSIKEIRYIREVLYYWRQHDTSEIHKVFGERDYKVLKDYYNIYRFMRQRVPDCGSAVLTKLYKVIFQTRYRGKNTDYKKRIKTLMKQNHKEIQFDFLKCKEIGYAYKILFLIFYYFPMTYDWFRKISDKRAEQKSI